MRMVFSRGHFLASLVLFSLTTILAAGCAKETSTGKSSSPSEPEATSAAADSGKIPTEAEMGDTSVPPELGGPGFKGEGWQTAPAAVIGDPNAVPGGAVTLSVRDWPSNLRMMGKEYNSHLNYILRDLCYQSLLGMDPNTLEYQPQLASHWQISEDKMTFRFRIDPRARWSDGKPIVADDVLATFDKHMDPTLLSPSDLLTFGKFHRPVAVSKYIVEVKAKDKNWRNFLYFAGSVILPAHEIKDITGTEYLDKYNYKFTAVSGPYMVHQEDIKSEQSVTVTRRDDFWARDFPENKGLYNFSKIRFIVVRDEQLAKERLIKGEIDFMVINVAEWWRKELPGTPPVEKGWLVRQQIYNDDPVGVSGYAINARKPPLNDVRVRKALQYLYDRKTLIEKLAYNEYKPLDSYYQGGEYRNPNNEMIGYDPAKAIKLLAEAGWKDRGPDGILMKDGKRLSIQVYWYSKVLEKYLTSYQQACRNAGVELRLEQILPETMFKYLTEGKYEMAAMGWGGLVFPNPETSFHSRLADEHHNNNITGFKDKQADAIMAEYDVAFTQEDRRKLIQTLDGILYNQHHYVLSWYTPYQRVAYWNKFGVPKFGLLRTSDAETSVFTSWWIDPQKAKALKEARRNGSSLPTPPFEIRYWVENPPAAVKAN